MPLPVYVTNSRLSRSNTVLAWGLAALVLVLIHLVGAAPFFRGVMSWIFRPVLVTNTRLIQTLEWPFAAIFEARRSARKVQELEVQYAQVISELSKLKGVQQENAELKRLLENTDRTFRETRVAGSLVSLARPAASIGQNSGIQVGNEVIVNGILIGSVSEVTSSIAFISLLTQTDHPPVLAKTNQDAKGIVVGTGRSLMLTEVPLDAPLEIGDRVISLGQPGISSDLSIGQVVRIEKDPASPVKEAQIEQIVDFYQTKIVEIVL